MNPPPDSASQCPQCGRPLPAGRLDDLCPGCLLAQANATESPTTGATPRFEAPTIAELAILFPQLEILERVGVGGMGAVYKARQPALGRIVALKIVGKAGPDGTAFHERFQREARALARLNHPHIVSVHEFGESGGLHYFLMEFVDGANLRQIQRNGRLSPREALEIIPQICDALQYAHDEGVVHRDIKPENVLVDRRGRVKIADFGIARIVGGDAPDSRLTLDGQVMGTPHYMAPEQVEQPSTVDHRADIYSLGVVFYELLTGDLPIGRFAPPSRKVEVDIRLDAIVLRALENDPARRYQHAGEVKTGVQSVAANPAPAGPAPAPAPEAPRGPRIHHLRWAGIPVVVERDGEREVSFQGALGALFLCMVLAMAGHLTVRGLNGREHALPGFVPLAGLLTAVWGIRRTLRHGIVQDSAPDDGSLEPPTFREAGLLLALFAGVVVSDFAKSRWVDPYSGMPGPAARGLGRSGEAGWTARLPGGGSVTLLALSRRAAAPNQFWGPDGTPLPGTTYEVRNPSEYVVPDQVTKDLLFRIRDLPDGADGPYFASEPASGHGWGGQVAENGRLDRTLSQGRFAWPAGTRNATLRVGFLTGPWVTVLTKDTSSQSGTLSWHPGEPQWQGTIQEAVATDKGCAVTYNFGPQDANWKYRMVAIDTNGLVRRSTMATGSPVSSSTVWMERFDGLALDAVKEFRIEVRPILWAEFRNIALEPRSVLPAPGSLAFGESGIREIPALTLIDLDTGRTADLPPDTAQAGPPGGLVENALWARRNGFDAMAGADGLEVLEMEFAPADANAWDNLTPKQVIDGLHRNAFATRVLRPDSTYHYHTRDGGYGLVQVLEAKPASGTVRVRLKPVRPVAEAGDGPQ